MLVMEILVLSLLTLNKTINAKSDKYCNLRYHAAPIFSTLSGVLLLWAFSLIRFQGNWYT